EEDGTSPWRALDHGVQIALECLERERGDGAVRQPETARVVLDQRVPACQPFEPAPIARLLPFELDVASGEWRHPDDDRPAATPGVSDAHAVGGGHVLDARMHGGHSRHPRTSAPAGSVLAGPRLVLAP